MSDQRVRLSSAKADDITEWRVPEGFPEDLTRAEYEEYLKANEQRLAGEFVLELEDPVARKLRRNDIERLTERIQRRRYEEGHRDALLDRFGMSAEQAETLEGYLSKVVTASLEAEIHLNQLLSARDEFKRRARSMMGDTKFAEYRDYEEGFLARGEVSRIQEFMQGNGVPVDRGALESLTELIRDAKAYTTDYWHGPFDGLPGVRVGHDAVLEGLRSDLDRQVRGSESLQAALANLELPPEMAASLRDHYATSIQRKQEEIDLLLKIKSLPPSEVRRMMGPVPGPPR